MPYNDEPNSPPEDHAQEQPIEPHDGEAGERVLGRGLEAVSHLFLSQRDEADGPCETTGPAATEPGPGPVAQDRSAALLRPCPEFTREQLAAFVIGHAKALEEGMRVIDVNAPCGSCGRIDVLGADRDRQLAIVDFDAEPYDGLLLRALAHFDWLTRHVTIVQHMYHGHDIDFDARPRIILIAPGFSPLLMCSVRQITCAKVDCLVYRAIQVPGGRGVARRTGLGQWREPANAAGPLRQSSQRTHWPRQHETSEPPRPRMVGHHVQAKQPDPFDFPA